MEQHSINIYTELQSKSADDNEKGDLIYNKINSFISNNSGTIMHYFSCENNK